ncbi:uncharacterized protein LOC133499116 isoform X2 [Syngnathoides biaculeatus]|uniref:uncharacterized protein LOC133499116 isoform X2 n=1 Tax=Syngnathoides biaculeatus TaxID=300417 RepID=UPI002ADE0DEF|nr:uncharacterized protein LOC133499116 isoform X2 [Syngnathoides biaculeatus]
MRRRWARQRRRRLPEDQPYLIRVMSLEEFVLWSYYSRSCMPSPATKTTKPQRHPTPATVEPEPTSPGASPATEPSRSKSLIFEFADLMDWIQRQLDIPVPGWPQLFQARAAVTSDRVPSHTHVVVATDPLPTQAHVALATDFLVNHTHVVVATDLLPSYAHITVANEFLANYDHAAVATDPLPSQAQVTVARDPLLSQAHVVVATDFLVDRAHAAVACDLLPSQIHMGTEQLTHCHPTSTSQRGRLVSRPMFLSTQRRRLISD